MSLYSVSTCMQEKKWDSRCSDGEAGQTHHSHTSETCKRVVMLRNWQKYHALDYISGLLNLDVNPCINIGIVCYITYVLAWKSLYWLCYPICASSICRTIHSNALDNSQRMPSEAVDSFAYRWSRKWSMWAIQPVKPHFKSLQFCVLCWCHRGASAFQTEGWFLCPSSKSVNLFFK